MDFSGKVAVVTGGASGIGKSCSLSFAQRGAKVVVLDFNEAGAKAVVDEIKEAGGVAIGLSIDISKVNQISSIVEAIIKEYNKIDILVNCAGITQNVALNDMTEKEWDRMMDINLKGTFFMCQAVINYMKKNKYGKIVNMGSIAGENGGMVVGVNYSASKAGVICMTKNLAKNVGAYGINVNTVSPGFIATPMTVDLNQDVNLVPLGKRKGTAEEVSDPILFLCSEYARYITGVNLDINGGLQMN